jgi:hypothetical protein
MLRPVVCLVETAAKVEGRGESVPLLVPVPVPVPLPNIDLCFGEGQDGMEMDGNVENLLQGWGGGGHGLLL